MGILFDDAQNEYLMVTSTPVTAAPFSIAASFNSDNTADGQVLVQIQDKDAARDRWTISINGEIAGDPVRFYADDNSYGTAQTTNGYSANTWHRVLGVETSSNDRHVILDGDTGNTGTDSTALTPDNADSIAIGMARDSSPVWPISGIIAEVMIWNVALTDPEARADAAGALVRPESLVCWWMLNSVGDLRDVIGDYNMTTFSDAAGPASAEHRPMQRYRRSQMIAAIIAAAPPGVARKKVYRSLGHGSILVGGALR